MPPGSAVPPASLPPTTPPGLSGGWWSVLRITWWLSSTWYRGYPPSGRVPSGVASPGIGGARRRSLSGASRLAWAPDPSFVLGLGTTAGVVFISFSPLRRLRAVPVTELLCLLYWVVL